MRSPLLTALSNRWAAIAFALSLGGCQVAAQLPPASVGGQLTTTRSVIVQLFEWSWPDVAQECEAWLGPNGYGAVQISPPHEHLPFEQGPTSFSWQQRYQTISYKLSSRSGNREQLAELISRCHQAGVKVYVDMVVNPMAEDDKATDDSPVKISEVLVDSSKTQAEIATAMNELLAMGAAGFRLETSQPIPPEHIAAILRQLHPLSPKFHPNGGRPLIYQDIGPTAVSQAHDYFGNGSISEVRYGRNLGEQVRHGQLKNLVLFGEAWGLVPSHKAIVFTDNHRTQRSRDRNIVTFKAPADNGASYRLANIFMLAWPYGTPKVMSSYNWSQAPGPWVANQTNENGQTLSIACGDSWVCEHRWPAIANMVQFRNVTQTEPSVDHWWDNGNSQIAFARGDRGFVVINNEPTELRKTLMTGLPAGQYCNVLATSTEVSNQAASQDCSTITVNPDGTAEFKVSPKQAVALHIGARP
ncbi:MAG: alpha-amylase family protein [Cyanobacteria bacterium P01_C01_bin.118]